MYSTDTDTSQTETVLTSILIKGYESCGDVAAIQIVSCCGLGPNKIGSLGRN